MDKTKYEIATEAMYTDQLLDDYIGNPLIEALPRLYDTEEIIEQMSVFPTFNPKERNLDNELRGHCIQRLFHFFQPLDKHLDLESKISLLIRQGYVPRNPVRKNATIFMKESYKAIKENNVLQTSTINHRKFATGFAVVGVSGIGKTTGIERVLNMYPQVLKHYFYNGEIVNFTQITWLKLDCPYDGSLKGLCISFFSELDRLLGTKYFQRYGSARNNISSMMQHMSHLARLNNIGVLIIDEIQHLIHSKSGGSEKMLNFFVTIVNTIGIPVILIGTNKAVSILQGDFRQARRGTGLGDFIWNRMEKNNMFNLFIDGLEAYQWTRKPIVLGGKIRDTLYEESQGIIDIVIKLFMLAQLYAIKDGSEKISTSIIRKVSKENLKLVQPMLEALRTGDIKALTKYEDIKPINIDAHLNNFKEYSKMEGVLKSFKEAKRKQAEKTCDTMRGKLIAKLSELDVDTSKILKATDKVITEYDSDSSDFSFLLTEATKIIFGSTKSKKGPKKSDINYSKDDLRLIANKRNDLKLPMYRLLMEETIIIDPYKSILKDGVEGGRFFSNPLS